MKNKILNETPYPNIVDIDVVKKVFSFDIKEIVNNNRKRIVHSLSNIPLDANEKTIAYEIVDEDGIHIALFSTKGNAKRRFFVGAFYFVLASGVYGRIPFKNFHFFRVEGALLSKNYIGRGLASKVYDYIISELEFPLVSGKSQSPGAQKLWMRLITKRDIYSVYILDLETNLLYRLNSFVNKDFQIKKTKKDLFDSYTDIIVVKRDSINDKKLKNNAK